MRRGQRLSRWVCVLGGWAWGLSAMAQGAVPESASERKAERERIAEARKAIAAEQTQTKAACYQRFAVEDCLRAARAKAREAEAPLKAREMLINDAERKEKAAERVKSIEERQGTAPGHPPASRPVSAVRQEPAAQAERRQQDAQRRADEQRSREQSRAKEQPQRDAAQATRAAEARERHEQTLKAAAERKQRLERQQAEDAAAGRKPAAPLPAPVNRP